MKTMTTILILAAVLSTSSVLASEWGGHYGTIHLSLDSADSVIAVADVAALGEMGVLVNVSAVLSDLAPLLYEGQRVLAAGGFELKLGIEGADDARVLEKVIDLRHIDVSEDPAGCMVGVFPDIGLIDGSAVLVTWKVLIPGPARPVKFVLDSSGVQSCAGLAGCADSGTRAIWSGSVQARQQGLLFSAGFVPAYLNWDGEADLTPVRGTTDWQDTGLFTLGN